MGNTSQLQTQTLLAFSSQRIVETHALDKTTIATIARISHNNVEIRAILRAAARHTNDYHSQNPIKICLVKAKGREFYDTLLPEGKQKKPKMHGKFVLAAKSKQPKPI